MAIGYDGPSDGLNPAVVDKKRSAMAMDAYGGLPEYANEGNTQFQIPGAQPNSERHRNSVGEAFNGQLSGYQDYLNNRQTNSDKLFNTYANKSKFNLARQMKGIKNDYNSRGLLGSGLQQDKAAGAVLTANDDLDQKRSSINGLIGQNVNDMENNLFNTGSILAQPGANTANPYLSGIGSDISRISNDSALAGELYGDIGKGAGAVLGNTLPSLMGGKSRNSNNGSIRYDSNPGAYGPVYGM